METKQEALGIVPAIRCACCKKLLDAESNDFITIHGNVTIGTHGGVIGDNFDEVGRLFRVFHFCKHRDCFYIVGREFLQIEGLPDGRPKLPPDDSIPF